MSCAYCTTNESLNVEIAVLRRQNDDLIKMLKTLMDGKIELRVSVGMPVDEKQREDLTNYMCSSVAAQGVRLLERSLQNRAEIYRELAEYKFREPLMFRHPS